MNPGILGPFSYIWRAFWSRMGTFEKHWLWFDPLVAKGFPSRLEREHSLMPPSFRNIAPDVSSILHQDDPQINLLNFF